MPVSNTINPINNPGDAGAVVGNTSLAAQQFFDTLQEQQQMAFQGQQAALQALSGMWAPVLQTGAIPYGYSAGLDQLLQSNIINQGAAATTNAINADQLRQQQQSGGAPALPSGANAQLAAITQATGQQKTAQTLAAEKEAGYQQGVENLDSATSAELGIAGAESPYSAAGAATGAGSLALNAGEAKFAENQATGPMSIFKDVMGGIGDVAGAASSIGNTLAQFGVGGGGGGGSDSGAGGGSAEGVEDDLQYI